VRDATAVVRPAQARLELQHGGVQGGVEVGGAGLGADDRTLAVAGDLDALTAVRLAWVLLVGEFDVYPDDPGVQALRWCQLAGDVLPVVLRHLDVATLDDDVHAFLLLSGVGTAGPE
jgi:hypothetical protein